MKILCLLLILIALFSNTVLVSAHKVMLEVDYDECVVNKDEDELVIPDDGEDEMWYCLNCIKGINTPDDVDDEMWQYHLSDNVYTVKYYFEDSFTDVTGATYNWTADLSSALIQEIKNAYINSMQRWNDVFFYTYNNQGKATAHKVIDIIEGTKDDHNLTIYPIDTATSKREYNGKVCIASTVPVNPQIPVEPHITDPEHYHYNEWKMLINVDFFYAHSYEGNLGSYDYVQAISLTEAQTNLERCGQHEFGHILGLSDIDNYCGADTNTEHHEEVLMGYGSGIRSTYAKYKDIAGVAITRGFHTDDDHLWMLRTNLNDDGSFHSYDVICAICNGVRKNISLTDSEYADADLQEYVYKSCSHHGGTNNEMILVATDGTRNFYKCRYCRQITEIDKTLSKTVSKFAGYTYDETIPNRSNVYFKLNVIHTETYNIRAVLKSNFTIELYNSHLVLTDLLTDNIYEDGGCNVVLEAGTYYIKVENDFVWDRNFNLSITPPPHTHAYTEYVKVSTTHHIEACECGLQGTVKTPHVVKSGTAIGNKGLCMYCGALINLGDDFVLTPTLKVPKVTANGSYILPSGIVVLVDEDIEAYLNGTLVFYDNDDVPVTE